VSFNLLNKVIGERVYPEFLTKGGGVPFSILPVSIYGSKPFHSGQAKTDFIHFSPAKTDQLQTKNDFRQSKLFQSGPKPTSAFSPVRSYQTFFILSLAQPGKYCKQILLPLLALSQLVTELFSSCYKSAAEMQRPGASCKLCNCTA
jgi:hypothetical protein